jgi:hypothetical protein
LQRIKDKLFSPRVAIRKRLLETLLFGSRKEQPGRPHEEQCIHHSLYSKVGEGAPTNAQEDRHKMGQTKGLIFGRVIVNEKEI